MGLPPAVVVGSSRGRLIPPPLLVPPIRESKEPGFGEPLPPRLEAADADRIPRPGDGFCGERGCTTAACEEVPDVLMALVACARILKPDDTVEAGVIGAAGAEAEGPAGDCLDLARILRPEVVVGVEVGVAESFATG